MGLRGRAGHRFYQCLTISAVRGKRGLRPRDFRQLGNFYTNPPRSTHGLNNAPVPSSADDGVPPQPQTTDTIMNKTRISTLAAGLLAALACHAQDEPQGPPPGAPPQPPPLLEALDSDGDKTISATEIEAAPESIRTLDADGDGTVRKEELRPKPPEGAPDPEREERKKGRPLKHPVPPVMAALDKNRDGALSGTEIDAAAGALLKLDKDGDGALTGEELRPPGKREPRADQEDGGEGGPPGPPPGGRGRPPGPPGQGGLPPRGR